MKPLFSRIARRRIAPLAVALLYAAASAWPCLARSAPLAGYEIVPLGQGRLNRLRLAVTIEGKKGLFVVDTGAGTSFLSQNTYSSLLPGPDRQLPAGVPKTANFNGTTVPVGYARDFFVANKNLGSLPLPIVPARFLFDRRMLYDASSEVQHDGYLGEDILRHYNAIVDVGRLALYLNTDPKRKIDAGHGLVAAGWTRIPMETSHGNFTVECSLGKTKFRVYVDTGSPFTVIDQGVVKSAQIRLTDLPMRAGLVATRNREMQLVMTDSFAIGNYTPTGVQLLSQSDFRDSLGSKRSDDLPVVGLLGGDVLSHHNALIDIGNHALYLKSSAPAAVKR